MKPDSKTEDKFPDSVQCSPGNLGATTWFEDTWFVSTYCLLILNSFFKVNYQILIYSIYAIDNGRINRGQVRETIATLWLSGSWSQYSARVGLLHQIDASNEGPLMAADVGDTTVVQIYLIPEPMF